MADPRSRSPILWLAVLLALAGALAVALDASRRGDVEAGGGREEQAGVAGEMLAGEGAAGAAPASGPRLRGAPVEPRATRGPVEVRVVDREDAPVAGMLVTATWSTPPEVAGGQPETHTQQTFTDALGRAPFSQLPYDGTATVAAHLRLATAEAPVPTAHVVRAQGDRFTLRLATLLAARAEAKQVEAVPGTDEAEVAERVESLRALAEALTVSSPAPPPRWPSPASAWAQAVVRGPEVRLVIDRGLPLRVDVREGGAGRPHPDARWKVAPRLAWSGEPWGAATLPVRRGALATVTLEVEAPRGMVARQPATFTPLIHPAARRLEAVYPLRPEAKVVLVFPPDVQPFKPEDWQGEVSVAGVRADAARQRFDAQGRLVVEGQAYLAGEGVSVMGRIGERWLLQGEALLGPTARDLVLVHLKARAAAPAATAEAGPAVTFTIEGGPEGVFVGSPGARRRVFVEAVGELRRQLGALAASDHDGADRPTDLPGTLVVTVLTPSGLPAAGATVRIAGRDAVCDAQGLARLERVGPGVVEVRAYGYGGGAAEGVSVPSGGEAKATLRCARGGTLEVEVLDEAGRGLPYATLTVTQPYEIPWIDLDGDLQRLDPYTGPDGKRTLRDVALGTVKVEAAFGSRRREVDVEVVEAGTQTVRIVLPSVILLPAPERTPEER